MSAVVTGSEGESTPSVRGGGTVDHVVGRSTALVGGWGSIEVVPSVGGHTHSVSRVRGSSGVELERTKVTCDVAGDGKSVGLSVSVRQGRGCFGTTGQGGVDSRFRVNTNGSPSVLGAVVDVDDVHAWAVLGANLQVSITVVVPQVLVEFVGHTGAGVHTVGTSAWVRASTSNPVTVEGAGAGVETGGTARATVRRVKFKEVLVRVAVVRELAVKEALWVEVAACVDVGGQHGHLLVGSWCVGWVDNLKLVRRWRRLAAGEGRLVANVRAVASLVEVLVLPVVLKAVTVAQVRRAGLELTIGGRAAARANGDEFTSVELVVGTQSVGGAAPGGSAVC